MLKMFYPVYPWHNSHKRWAMLHNEYIPTTHVAEMTGMTKDDLLVRCTELKIDLYKEPDTTRLGRVRSYSAYISTKYFPTLLKSLGWKQADIEEGIQSLELVKSRTRNGYYNKRRTIRNKNDDEVEDIDDDDDEDDDEEDKFKKTTLSSSVVPRKRDRSSESSPPPTSSTSSVSDQLKRMETLYEQTHALVQKQSKMFEQSMNMMGEQALLTYVKTDTWRAKKEKALQEAIAAELPSIRETVKHELKVHYDPIIQAQVRKEHENKLQNNNNAEAEVFRSVLSKQRNLVIVPSSPPRPATTTINTPHNNAVWLSAFLQEEKNNYTE